MNRFLRPFDGVISGEERAVFLACFEKKQYGFSLWNKVFSAELCKKALPWMKDAFLPKAQDKLAFLMISYFAKSYRGIPDKVYYHYYFGRGCTGFEQLTIKQFTVYCNMSHVANEAKRFLQEMGSLQRYSEIEKENRTQLLSDCMERWLKEVAEQDRSEAFDILLKYWAAEEVITVLAQKKWYDKRWVANAVKDSRSLQYDRRPVKTIATYYYSCFNGGLQRVLCDLSRIWTDMGYQVVVITDMEPSDKDYAMPAAVKREIIPCYETINKDNYECRCRAIKRIIEENHVDAVVYHAWVNNMLLWDAMSVKTSGAALLIHCHSVFSMPILNAWNSCQSVIAPYYCADAVVTLSRVDKAYWSYMNSNVHEVINPFTDGVSSWKPQRNFSEHNILWVGRIAKEKNPFDALSIISRVVEQVPDAVLHVVGEGKNTELDQEFRNEVQRRGLQKNVVLEGFHADVRYDYENSQVFLMTSSYEGYSLTLQESKLAGIPCVMYRLPYLTLCERERGLIAVDQGDTEAAAREIVGLLTDPGRCARYGNEARKHVEELFGYSFENAWKTIFDSVSEEHKPCVSREEQIMLETLIEHHDHGLRKARNTSDADFSEGRIIRYAVLFQKGVNCLKTEGIFETAKRTLRKIIRYAKSNDF